jgi:hypothetical protein
MMNDCRLRPRTRDACCGVLVTFAAATACAQQHPGAVAAVLQPPDFRERL